MILGVNGEISAKYSTNSQFKALEWHSGFALSGVIRCLLERSGSVRQGAKNSPDLVVVYRTSDMCPPYDEHMSLVRSTCVNRTMNDNKLGGRGEKTAGCVDEGTVAGWGGTPGRGYARKILPQSF